LLLTEKAGAWIIAIAVRTGGAAVMTVGLWPAG